ncbi:MAG TPA: hypothetical protein VM577_11560 [Anaerovoracaceae bacterium]|nr:hypothetical protein [Anaerovoracaceae bacterium]
MSSSQPAYCIACGKSHKTNFTLFHGYVCSWRCWDELNWRETLSNLGKEYYPIPEEAQVNKAKYEYSPFIRPAEGFENVSEADLKYLQGEPQPPVIMIPINIDPHENIP